MWFAALQAQTDFHRKLRAGDVMHLGSTVARLGGKTVTFRHHLKNVAIGDAAMSTEFKCALLDLEKRQAKATPEGVRKKAAALIGEEPS